MLCFQMRTTFIVNLFVLCTVMLIRFEFGVGPWCWHRFIIHTCTHTYTRIYINISFWENIAHTLRTGLLSFWLVFMKSFNGSQTVATDMHIVNGVEISVFNCWCEKALKLHVIREPSISFDYGNSFEMFW